MATKRQIKTLRKKLISVARCRGYIAYSDIDHIFELDVIRRPPDRYALSQILGDLGASEVAAGGVFLVSVVVRKGKKRPGNGFYEAARQHCPQYRHIKSDLDLHTQALQDAWSWAENQKG